MNHFNPEIGKSVRKLIAAALSLALTVSAAPARAQPASLQSGDLAAAVGALRAISTMRADFVQVDRNGQQIKGVLSLKRPGKIRFQYEKGVPILVVSNGAALTFVDYSVKQVQRWPIKNSPLGALLDPTRDVMKFGRLIATDNRNVVGIEVRDKGHPEFGVITMLFVRKVGIPGGLELSSWAALDSQNSRTIVTLSNQQYGMAIPENTFQFNDPRAPTRR